jgi:hypothetical protein
MLNANIQLYKAPTQLPHCLNPSHKPYNSPSLQSTSLFPLHLAPTMALCASISLENKKHTHTKSISIVDGVKKLLLLGCSCRVSRAKKSHFQSVKLEMEPEVEAAAQGYEGMASTAVQPLWQKRVLMGERCEMPRFSGLILYDERGFPLPSSNRSGPTNRVSALSDSFLDFTFFSLFYTVF